jgi:phospholipid/cholesterol/gamma-HCH transport system permease protein
MATNSSHPAKYFISKSVDQFFISIHDIFKFILQFFKEVFRPPYEFQEVIRQCYLVGYRSLFLITVTGFITGIVFTKHSRPSLASFGATSWLPSLIGIAVIKALAPLITSLICAGKISSRFGAELGSMKVTEQIDAMEVSAINPFKFLVVTRVIASTLMIPVLVMYSAFVGLAGSFLNVHKNEKTSMVMFIHDAFTKIAFNEFSSSLIRSVLFGFTIGIIGCFYGYNAAKGTEGVGKAANIAVVIAMFLIFIEEMIIVQGFNLIFPDQ